MQNPVEHPSSAQQIAASDILESAATKFQVKIKEPCT